ncbi:hypothetical protein [Mycoplasma sp. CSL7503-lung]|uniref:hypothetical protein n=1 Tax=Mycoplasma sp. CSL7503-lung TaxID=536372 RepID=UPI0021CDFF3A|nr:hypothetical protein [Mycoplasma sp. CSL7503-lung]MCU4706775.1 hypothetical protein [Mycoplasma sp. CSL7503-lung]
MFKSKKRIFLFSISSIATTLSISSSVAIMLNWNGNNLIYENDYKKLKKLINKWNHIPKNILDDFNKIKPIYKNKNQILDLKKIKERVFNSLILSILDKESKLKI